MSVIGEFPVDRFKNSANLLVTLLDKRYMSVWLNAEDSTSIKGLIYKCAFMDCVEYLYGFIPEVFREYCKYYDIVVYSGLKRAGHLDFMKALYDEEVLTIEYFTLLKKIFNTCGELIHSTLWSKEEYYRKLEWIVVQLTHSDLQGLCDFIMIMCSKINYKSIGNERKRLVVKSLKESNSLVISNSNCW